MDAQRMSKSKNVLLQQQLQLRVYYVVANPIVAKTWNYNIRRNINSGFSIVTMRRVATILFFELGVPKIFVQKFNLETLHDYFIV